MNIVSHISSHPFIMLEKHTILRQQMSLSINRKFRNYSVGKLVCMKKLTALDEANMLDNRNLAALGGTIQGIMKCGHHLEVRSWYWPVTRYSEIKSRFNFNLLKIHDF